VNDPDDPAAGAPALTPGDLARAVLARRTELRMSQDDVRRVSGLSVTTVARIEHGDTDPDLRVQRATLRRLDLALRWPVGSCEAWYEGRRGVVPDPPGVLDGETIEQLAARVLRVLESQRAIDPSVMSVLERFDPRTRRAIARALEVLADELGLP
jgi:transcriptional regulator with XRE-family HTH domain